MTYPYGGQHTSTSFATLLFLCVLLCGVYNIQEIIPKYFDGSDVGVVSGGVEQTTALLAEK